MSRTVARALVFVTSAAVLVLEILAGRLLAPYVGVTIETFTGIIGVVLAGISAGAWFGGRLADRRPPRTLLGPLLIAGGLLALLAPTVVHWVGPSMRAAGPAEIVTVTTLAFFLPAVALSAVTPIVVKLRLQSLSETGTVVGTLSAVGTVGAIFGTFVTGFVLIAALPTDWIVVAVGVLLIAVGIATSGPLAARTLQIAPVPVLLAASLLVIVDGPCDRETTYFCAYVTVDEDRPTGRVLWLDTLRHSYIDLEDPTYLEFSYSRRMADVLATLPEGPLDVLSIGGGGFTLPRYLNARRPGSRNVVLEIDQSLIGVAERELGLTAADDLTIKTGDARVLLREEPAGAFDLVIGDAFGGRSVPWHLTTREFVSDIRDRLRPGGIYLLNMIDQPPHRFARAEAATLAAVFSHVLIIAPPEYLTLEAGGNFVLAAGDAPFDLDAIREHLAARGSDATAVSGQRAATFLAGARVLSDDYAPVDQLISRP